MSGDDNPVPPKFTVSTATYRTVYTTAYRGILNHPDMQRVNELIDTFSSTSSIDELNDCAKTLDSLSTFLSRKLDVLGDQYRQWHAMLSTITDADEQKQETECLNNYFKEPDENGVVRDPVHLRSTYSQIVTEIETCFKCLNY